eukprot:m.221982 g.221982  ORF g.221982 m.221982 type:complete len:52 (-) comp18729_c2_seq5:101-256(-)
MAEGRKARITARELKMAVMVVLVLFCQAITTPTATPTARQGKRGIYRSETR